MTSKLVVNTIESDTGISSVSFASSISMSSTSKFFFGAAGIDIGADTNINRPTAGVLGFNINSSEKVRITSDGRIGINTTSPTYGMHLHGTTASSNAYYYAEQSSAGASAGFRLKTTGSHFSIYGATSGSALGIYDYNAGAERVTITSGGNILVGTTVDSNNKVTLYGNNASVLMQNAATNTGASNGFYLGNGNGTLCYVWNYENDAIQFATNNTERLRITNNGQLNTYTTGTITADFNTSNGAGSYLQFDTGASGANIGYIGAGSQLVTGSSTNDLGFRSANHMVFSTGGSVERLRINSNGDTFFTTSSTIVLDLNTTSSSGAYLQFDVGASGANIGYMGAGSQLVTGSATADLGIRSAQNFVISTGGSTERLRIDTNGKVKIGSSGGTPDGKLHIDEIGSGDIVAELTANSPMFTYRNGSGSWFHAGKHPSDDAYVVTTGGTTTTSEKFRIDGDGYVTKPQHPAWHAWGANSWTSYSGSNNLVTFPYSDTNVGSHYKTSGTDAGKFICPVAGTYFFYCTIYSGRSDNSQTDNSDYMAINLYSDSNNLANKGGHHIAHYYNEGDRDSTRTLSYVKNCSAGEKLYVTVSCNGTNFQIYGGHSAFGGYLIG